MIAKGDKINDRYQIIRSIGEGGMANVYLAYDTILDRNVAVKILRGDLATDEKFVRRFQREAISASSLSHPNIVEMYDVGEDDGKYFIVMEYLEGKTLKSLVKKRGALTLSEVVDIMLQLTSAVACAHDSYIIHRDIKPQNVLILDDGKVKITDFGIAMALNSNELTQTNSVMGSVHYLPPEQANGTGASVKSDIYSLGILMYELLTGKLPFKGENAVEIAIKQMRDPIPSVCEFNPEIPQSIENIVLKAAAKNPKNRYNSVAEMHDDIASSLTEARKNEKKLTYMYSEVDFDEDKHLPTREKLNEDIVEAKSEEIKVKKLNKAALFTAIGAGVVILLTTIFLIVMSNSKPKDIEIPDVSKKTVVEAEKELEKLGFEVNTKTEEKASSTIAKGKVVETSPSIGRTVKAGTKITLIVSTGTDKIKIKDYTNQDFETVKNSLEKLGLNVIGKEKEITKDDNLEEGTIIEQDIEEGKKLTKGDTITLTFAKIIVVYPDFVNENYTLDEVEVFCEDNEITLNSVAKETDEVPENYIISQTRQAGSKVVKGVTLRVTYAKKKPEEPKTDTSDKETKETTDKTTTEKTDTNSTNNSSSSQTTN